MTITKTLLELRAIWYKLHYFLPLRHILSWYDLFSFCILKENNSFELKGIRLKCSPSVKTYIRKFSITDKIVFKYVFFNKYHIPPILLKENCVILDLGANIGLTMIDLKQLYPKSKILGFEMDTVNFEIAKKNVAQLENCSVYNKAIWYETTTVNYAIDTDNDAYAISESPLKESATTHRIVEALVMDDVLQMLGLDYVDFLKMDIEGSEKEVLQHGERDWLRKVNVLNIEIHEPTFLEEAMCILESFGFRCRKDTNHWSAILAIRSTNTIIE